MKRKPAKKLAIKKRFAALNSNEQVKCRRLDRIVLMACLLGRKYRSSQPFGKRYIRFRNIAKLAKLERQLSFHAP